MTSMPTAAPHPTTSACSSHYDAVVWYTGNDVVTREPGWGAGNASRLAMQELLEVRDFVNEGGRVLYTGQSAGQQYTPASRHAAVRPVREPPVPRRPRPCRRAAWPCSGSGDSQGDPIEYLFGAAITTPGGGSDPDTGEPFDVAGIDDPLAGPVVGIQRRRQRPEPGHELVVHRDRATSSR